MASIAIFSPLQTSHSFHSIKKQHAAARSRCSFRAKHTSQVVSWDVEGQKTLLEAKDHSKPSSSDHGLKGIKSKQTQEMDKSSSQPKFDDKRRKNGNCDLNMFVKDRKIDWDAMIVAGAAANQHTFSFFRNGK